MELQLVENKQLVHSIIIFPFFFSFVVPYFHSFCFLFCSIGLLFSARGMCLNNSVQLYWNNVTWLLTSFNLIKYLQIPQKKGECNTTVEKVLPT